MPLASLAPFSPVHLATNWPSVAEFGTVTLKLPALATVTFVPEYMTPAGLSKVPAALTTQYTWPAVSVVPVTVTVEADARTR